MSTTYTVYDPTDSSNHTSGLSAAEAADMLLSDDGQEWEVRPLEGEPGFVLWTRQQVAGRKWTKCAMWSLADTLEAATAEILGKVLVAETRSGPEAMTDKAFARMQADVALDMDDEDA
jgi:hypothetical protein